MSLQPEYTERRLPMLADVFAPETCNVILATVSNGTVNLDGDIYFAPSKTKVLDGSRVKVVKLPGTNSGRRQAMIKGEKWTQI